jgi:LuxR family maltose regulon positive regulatory protein
MVKISRPKPKDAYLRHRLFKQLDHMRRFPVIWVSAPAGSGKTTLVSSYIGDRNIPCLWYQFDMGDADVATFFYYMGEAAKKVAPRKRISLPLLTPEYLQGVPTFALRYFEQMYDRLTSPFLLVFDNYHEVPLDSPLHEVMICAFSLLPEGINAVVISRNDPPSTLSRLRANRSINLIRWEDVKLTDEEARGIITNRADKLCSKETMHRLYKLSDGWAAGLVLMSEVVKRENIDPQLIGQHTFEEIFAYFAEEVFLRLDHKTAEFLLKTAFLPKTTAHMAEQLTGEPSAGDILRDMHRNNYFIMRHTGHEAAYEYHPLYRNFLLSRSLTTFSPETLSMIRRTAAGILEKAKMTEAAVTLLKDIADWDAMIDLINNHAPDMLKQGRHHSLRQWLDSLPSDITKTSAWLLYWQGMSNLPFTPHSAQLFFEDAFNRFQTNQDRTGAIMAASGVVNAINLKFDDFTPLDHWYMVLRDLSKSLETFPTEEIEVALIPGIIMAIGLREMADVDIDTWEERVLHMVETPATIPAKSHTLHLCFWYRMLGKNFADALPLLNELRRISQLSEAQPLIIIETCSAEVMYYLFTGLHNELMKSAQRGLDTAKKTGVHIEDMWFYNHTILSFLNRMDCDGARVWLDKIPTGSDHWPNWAKCLYHLQLMLMDLINKDQRRALYQGQLALDYANDTGSRVSIAQSQVLLSQTLHVLGKYDEASHHLEQARFYAQQRHSSVVLISVLITDTLFAFDRGDNTQGLLLLRQSFGLARECGYMFTPLNNPIITINMCEKALEAGIEVEYVCEIIRRRGLLPEKSPVHIENWPWSVKVYTLGRFGIVQDSSGNRGQSPRKAQHIPLRLLKALISLGGREVDEERITTLLWPDADGDLAHRSFTITLHRLRKLLGNADTLKLSEGKLTLDNRYCWVDAWAFERFLGQADAYKQSGKIEAAQEAISKALALYRGRFLDGEREESWMVSTAERLRSKFLNGVTWIGEHLEKTYAWDHAAKHYERCLTADDCSETIYRRLMACYSHLERKSEALAVYERCRKVLISVLDIPPSAETEALKASLRSNLIE